GRGRQGDRGDLGPVRRRGGGPRRRGGGGGGAGAPQRPAEAVEQPRTDPEGVAASGRARPVVEPQVETAPAPVAEAPDTTTPKTAQEDPSKLEQSGTPSRERTRGAGSGSRGGKRGRS